MPSNHNRAGAVRPPHRPELSRPMPVVGWLLLALAIGFALVLAYRQTAPPLQISLAAGPEGAGYHAIATRYRDALARRGVTLHIVETSGAAQNLDLIAARRPRVDAALIQGGLAAGRDHPGLVSVGRHFYEPLLIFTRPALGDVDRLGQLAGRRIAVGGEGTGTQILVKRLLAANGVTGDNTTFLALPGVEAEAALMRGEIDAALFVMALDSPITARLLRARDVRLASMARTDAYARRFAFLTPLTLPQGALDLVGDRPARRIDLVAVTAALVVRRETHPAMAYLLAEVASQVHDDQSLLGRMTDEERARDPEFEVADAAMRYYRHGAPFLHRHFPFWVADVLERALLWGVPFAAVLFPLLGGLYRLHQWRVRRQIERWYHRLMAIEGNVANALDTTDYDGLRRRLQALAQEVRSARVPASHTDQVFQLLEHLRAVGDELAFASAGPDGQVDGSRHRLPTRLLRSAARSI